MSAGDWNDSHAEGFEVTARSADDRSGYSLRMRMAVTLVLALGINGLVACGNSQTPEAQVRSTIEALELAAEARDVGGVLEHLSDQFRDAHGRDGAELSQYIRGYFIANQSIHLLTRIDTIGFPTQTEARVQVTVGMVGREAAAANAWNLAAEVRDFDVTLMLQDRKWKVTHASWGESGDR